MSTVAGTRLLQLTSYRGLAGLQAGFNYEILILFDNSPLSLLAATAPRMWAVGWLGLVIW